METKVKLCTSSRITKNIGLGDYEKTRLILQWPFYKGMKELFIVSLKIQERIHIGFSLLCMSIDNFTYKNICGRKFRFKSRFQWSLVDYWRPERINSLKKNLQIINIVLLGTINLRKVLTENGLVDVGYTGLSFAWFNNRSNLVVIFERLDRAMAN